MRCMWILFVTSSCMIYAFSEKRINVKNNLFSGGRKINKGVVEGDIILRKFRSAGRKSSYKWPNGTVPYVISKNFFNQADTSVNLTNTKYAPKCVNDEWRANLQQASNQADTSVNLTYTKICSRYVNEECFKVAKSERITIRTAMIEIEINTRHNVTNCITFVKRTTEANYLNIQQQNGCSSYVGRTGGAQMLDLGSGCEFKGAIMHELIHALGFYHEHNRYDRNRYIKVQTSNIAVGDRPEFYKETNRTMNLLRTSYDFGSIMHYNAYEGSLNKSLPSMTPKLVRKSAGVTMGQHFTMSKLDVERIQRWYKCKIDTSHIIMFETVFWCSFDKDLCNLQQDTQDDFDWKSQVSGTSTDGTRPFADFTNGVGSYIYAEVKAHRGQKARLLTPPFDRGQYCIHFGIYFVNPQKGVFTIRGTGPNITEHNVLTIMSIYEAEWQEYMIDLLAPSTFRLILQAEIGDGDGSDIAIDDFALHHGLCSDLVF